MKNNTSNKQVTGRNIDVNAEPDEWWGSGPHRPLQSKECRLPIDPDALYKVPEVCEYLGVSGDTWAKWRGRSVTPIVIRIPNGSLRVKGSDLVKWMDDRRESNVA